MARASVIQVDAKPAHIGRCCGADIGVVGHVKTALAELIPLLKQNTTFVSGLQSQCKKWGRKIDLKASRENRNGVPPQAVTRLVGDMADNNTIFVVDVGEITAYAARHLRTCGTHRIPGSFNHGSLRRRTARRHRRTGAGQKETGYRTGGIRTSD